MTHELDTSTVNLNEYPKVKKSEQNNQRTIGDLNGNYLRFMHFLITEGVLEISETDYAALVRMSRPLSIRRTPASGIPILSDVYKVKLSFLSVKISEALDDDEDDSYPFLPPKVDSFDRDTLGKELEEYKEILARAKVNTELFVRSLQDGLCDRGCDDYRMLLLLKLLHDKGVSIELLLSNHDYDFIQACECFSARSDKLKLTHLDPQHAVSFVKMIAMIEQNLVSVEEVLSIYREVYAPALKILSYGLNKTDNSITIYSHAAIGVDTIKNLANKFGVKHKDRTAADLGSTIDAINVAFKKYVNNGSVYALCDSRVISSQYNSSSAKIDNPKNYPVEIVMWNRDYEVIHRPHLCNGYTISYVHGHDSNDLSTDNNYVLDTPLGKASDHLVGPCNILRSKHDQHSIGFTASLNELPDSEFSEEPLGVAEIRECIRIISKKADDLRSRKFFLEADVAKKLAEDTHQDLEQYIGKPSDPDALSVFKSNANQHIEAARPILEKHRGWKQILGNLLLSIALLGVGYVAAISINKIRTGRFLFFQKTDSADKIDLLKKSIESLEQTDVVVASGTPLVEARLVLEEDQYGGHNPTISPGKK